MERRIPACAAALLAATIGGCFFPVAPAPTPVAAPGANYDAYAASMGYPARHTPQELEQFLATQLAGYQPVAGSQVQGRLEAPQAVSLQFERGRCYFMVLRLGPDAAYSERAQAGLSFIFQPAAGGATVNGGPGIHGPGGAGSGGCPQQGGPYAFSLEPIVGGASGALDLGQGSYSLELWSKPISDAELQALAADQAQQIAESDAFRAQQEAEENARNQQGCNTCNSRYQGCIGAHMDRSQCDTDYRSCAFEQVGADWMSVCPNPQ